ncbi:MAG TPA: polysaccharide biosynthesis tyrosine autokinase [Gemmataceae bacterium]|jgi:capsular exopolysaccharide synthesis family protein|nr:polysaccharide biosynthesis tyrosine autokinase [Gemmataceae bacterium]
MPHDAGLPDPAGNVPSPRRGPSPVAGRVEVPAALPLPDAAPPPGLASGPDAGALLRALRRRWVAAALLGGTLATVAGLTAWFLLSPKYTAFATLKVAYAPPVVGLVKQEGVSRADFGTYMRTQAAQLKSRPVIWAALKRDEVKRLNLEAREKDPVSFVEDELKVDFADNSELLTVYMNSNDPQVSLVLANAIKEAYMDEIVYAENQARVNRVAELEKVYANAVSTAKTKKKSLEKLAESLGGDPSSWVAKQLELQSAIRDAQTQANTARFQLVKAQSALDSQESRAKAVEQAATSPTALEAALDADAEAKSIEKQIDRARDLLNSYADRGANLNAPTPLAAARRIKSLEKQLEDRKVKLRADLKKRIEGGTKEESALARLQLENEVKQWKGLHEQLQADVGALLARSAKMNKSSGEYDGLNDETKRAEAIVADIDSQLQREKIELQAAPRISRYQDAELQKKDIKKQLLAAGASPLAMLLAVCTGLAWFEYRKRRVQSAGEVSHGLGIRVVGAVPDLPNLERHLIGPGGEPELEGHPVLESIDAIRTLLLHDADARATRVVMVTSAASGEGKTTLAAHLAGSLARAGRKTLLIDGDLRTPAAHQLFELPMQPGFSEVLLGEVEAADAVQETPIEGLSLMAAGQWDREVLYALARGGMEGVFEKLQEEFDFVIIDSHPVLAATDSLLIGQRVDAVILSVLREVSQMPKVYAAAQRLTALNIRVLGAVVNASDPEEALAAPGHALAAGAR